MAETKSTSRAGSKLNLNESTMPLLDEEAHEKAETPEKDAIEMKEKASTTSEGEKDDSNPEKTVIMPIHPSALFLDQSMRHKRQTAILTIPPFQSLRESISSTFYLKGKTKKLGPAAIADNRKRKIVMRFFSFLIEPIAN